MTLPQKVFNASRDFDPLVHYGRLLDTNSNAEQIPNRSIRRLDDLDENYSNILV